MNYNRVYLVLTAAVMMMSCGKEESLPRDDEKKPPKEPVYFDYIKNPGFDEPIDTKRYNLEDIYDPYGENTSTNGWKFIGGWNYGAGEIFYSETEGVDGSPCLGLKSNSTTAVDLIVAQVIEGLDPDKTYRISAKVKVKNVSGFGANICSGNGYCMRSDIGIKGSSTVWETVNFDIDHAPGGKALICLRLGYSGDASAGTVYFDDVTISDQSELYVCEGEHIKISFDKSKLSVSTGNIVTWVSNLDKMYLAYKDLFSGRMPFEGNKLRVRGMADFGAWAWAGYPILWNSAYIASELKQISLGHWSFGIMHEMGHDFSSTTKSMSTGNTAFNFNEELFANFRMYLAMMKVPEATVFQTIDGTEYKFSGAGIGEMYKITYDKTLGAGLQGAGGDGIQYTFVRIAEKYGQELFKKTFDYLYKLPANEGPVSGSSWDKFNFFLDSLNKFVEEGENVRSTFSQNDLDLIQAELQ